MVIVPHLAFGRRKREKGKFTNLCGKRHTHFHALYSSCRFHSILACVYTHLSIGPLSRFLSGMEHPRVLLGRGYGGVSGPPVTALTVEEKCVAVLSEA
jgi:hypothetical protein